MKEKPFCCHVPKTTYQTQLLKTILFDSCSKRYFITNKLVEILGIDSSKAGDCLQLTKFASKEAVSYIE